MLNFVRKMLLIHLILISAVLPLAAHADSSLVPPWRDDDRFADVAAPTREAGELSISPQIRAFLESMLTDEQKDETFGILSEEAAWGSLGPHAPLGPAAPELPRPSETIQLEIPDDAQGSGTAEDPYVDVLDDFLSQFQYEVQPLANGYQSYPDDGEVAEYIANLSYKPKTVIVPEGHYRESLRTLKRPSRRDNFADRDICVDVPPGIWLKGSGDVVLEPVVEKGTNTHLVNLNMRSGLLGFTLKGCSVPGFEPRPETRVTAITVYHEAVVANCQIYNFTHQGISAAGSRGREGSDVIAWNNIIENIGHSGISGQSRWLIQDNQIRYAGLLRPDGGGGDDLIIIRWGLEGTIVNNLMVGERRPHGRHLFSGQSAHELLIAGNLGITVGAMRNGLWVGDGADGNRLVGNLVIGIGEGQQSRSAFAGLTASGYGNVFEYNVSLGNNRAFRNDVRDTPDSRSPYAREGIKAIGVIRHSFGEHIRRGGMPSSGSAEQENVTLRRVESGLPEMQSPESFGLFISDGITSGGEHGDLLYWRFDMGENHFVEDMAGGGHVGWLQRGDYDMSYPERVSEGLDGEGTGAVRLTSGASVELLAPAALPNSWTLSFWMKDDRSDEAIPEHFAIDELVSLRTQLLGLSRPWYFRTDPGLIGVDAGWHKGENGDGWDRIEVPAFWSETHVGASYYGYGWYTTLFYVPEELADMAHELHFEGVDEQAWVYVNGELVGEKSVESTGKRVQDIWNKPFSVTIKPQHLQGGEWNRLAVRSHASGGEAGIFRPVYFIPPEGKQMEIDLSGLVAERATPGGWEHLALAVEPGKASLYVNGVLTQVKEPFQWPADTERVQLKFSRHENNNFIGIIDEVRILDTAVKEERAGQLARFSYHPDAPWLAEHDGDMRRLISEGRLSKDRAELLAGIGAPDKGAMTDTLERSESVNDQVMAVRGLSLYGGYESFTALIRNLETRADEELVKAVNEALILFDARNDFQAFLRQIADEGKTALLSNIIQNDRFDLDFRVSAVEVHPKPGEEASGLIGMLKDHQVTDEVQLDTLEVIKAGGAGMLEEIEREPETGRVLARLAHPHAPNRPLRLAAQKVLESMGQTPEDITDDIADWPPWRYEKGRGAATPHQLSAQLHLNWKRELGSPRRAWPEQRDDYGKLAFDVSFEPVAAGGIIYVPSMVSDRLSAFDADSGEELWRHYADGPIRFAPVVWEGRIYFTSDDGRLYCLDAESGEELWRVQGGPSQSMSLGNERLINRWPARVGPVMGEGVIYFAAGIWPFQGVYVHAVDAGDGNVLWTNTEASDHLVSAFFGYRGIAPQGYMALSGDRLIVPNGRATPAVFDAESGELLYFRQTRGEVGQAAGGYRIYAQGDWFFNESPCATGRRSIRIPQTTLIFSVQDGAQLDGKHIHVLSDDYWIGVSDDKSLFAYDSTVRDTGKTVENRLRWRAISEQYEMKRVWETDPVESLDRVHLKAGSTLYGSGPGGKVLAIEMERNQEKANGRARAAVSWSGQVDGEVFSMIAARGRLFVVTEEGTLYCFSPEERSPAEYPFGVKTLPEPPQESTDSVSRMLESIDRSDGYALVLGIGDGDILDALIQASEMHIVAVDPDEEKVDEMRRRLDDAGFYGRRAGVIHHDPADLDVPPHMFELVLTEDLSVFEQLDSRKLVRVFSHNLRPYGGVAFLPLPADRRTDFESAVRNSGLENLEYAQLDDYVRVRRTGKLHGAGRWTHELADAANTKHSTDTLVKGPLGIAWFGGPDNSKVLPRHGDGPVSQVVRGRSIIMGTNHLMARCVYTGRELWSKNLPDVGQAFSTTRHQPGSTHVGSPYVSTDDSVYVIHEDRCLRLDLRTGKQLKAIDMPSAETLQELVMGEAGSDPEPSYALELMRQKLSKEEFQEVSSVQWGNIRIKDDFLIAAAYPHRFDDSRVGGQNWNHTSSEYLVVIDRHSGEVMWAYRARYGIRHTGVAAGADRVFVLDNLSDEIQERLARRGTQPDMTPVIHAFETKGGEKLWSYDDFVFGTLLSYSAAHDIVVQGGRPNWVGRYTSHRLEDEPLNDKLNALSGSDGAEVWRLESENGLRGPVSLNEKEKRIYGGSGGVTVCLLTGETGAPVYSLGGHGCGSQNTGQKIITFRAGSAAYYDIIRDESVLLSGFRSGCNENMVPADGVLVVPDYTRTCSCNYKIQTSLGLVYSPGKMHWSQ